MLLSVAHLSRPTFYDEIKRMKKGNKCASVKREIQAIFKEHRGRYGYRRITAELENRKIHCNHKVVSRLMKELGLVCREISFLQGRDGTNCAKSVGEKL